MAAQFVRVALLLLTCLLALASPAAINIASSLEDADLNVVPSGEPQGPINLNADDLSLLVGVDEDDDEAEVKPYVDASEFRQPAPASFPADSVKAKASSLGKKALPGARKQVKQGHEVKVAISTKLEPPVEEQDVKLEYVVSALRTIIQVAGKNIIKSFTAEPNTAALATPTATSSINEDAELPRLSPPIWDHSSQADPLHLPLVEPYDRYDRYSHSIARDIVW